jgi:L-amino acid N-acyltransferase YncA
MARVLPEQRGQGVGTILYEALSKDAAGLGLTSLWGRIEEGDTASLCFVEHRGFREVSREYEFCSTSPGLSSQAILRPASSS